MTIVSARLWVRLQLGRHSLPNHIYNIKTRKETRMYIPPFTISADSGPFIDFMLGEIQKTLEAHKRKPIKKVPNKIPNKVPDKLLQAFPRNAEYGMEHIPADSSQRTSYHHANGWSLRHQRPYGEKTHQYAKGKRIDNPHRKQQDRTLGSEQNLNQHLKLGIKKNMNAAMRRYANGVQTECPFPFFSPHHSPSSSVLDC